MSVYLGYFVTNDHLENCIHVNKKCVKLSDSSHGSSKSMASGGVMRSCADVSRCVCDVTSAVQPT
jgi:hypothetical protein